MSNLLAEEYRTIAIDMPGFGAANEVQGYSMEQVTRQFAEVIVGLGLERYVLVGHSMTGKVMQILASRMGTEIGLKTPPEKLLLVTPTPLGKEVGGEEMRTMLLAAQNNRWDAEKFVATHSGLSLSSTVKKRTMQDYMQANRAAWEAWLNEDIREDWIERAAPVEVETLLVAAIRDPVWGPPMQQKLTLPHLANARMITVDSGHLIPLEGSDRMAEIIREFVEA